MTIRRGRSGRARSAGAFFLLVLGAAGTLAAAPDGGAEGRKPRFRVEVFGGAAVPGLADLNALAAADRQVQDFSYDRLYESRVRSGQLVSWTRLDAGNRAAIRLGVPLGLRVRWDFARSFAVSLGLAATSARRESQYRVEYRTRTADGYADREILEYRPFLLAAASWAVLAGIHFAPPPSGRLGWEAFLSAGPLLASCRHLSSWTYVWNRAGDTWSQNLTELSGRLEERGRGIGFAADAGGALRYALGPRWAVFLEGAYVLQRVGRVKGPGRETRGTVSTEWDGDWAFKRETLEAPWGSLAVETPTNFWPDGSSPLRGRRFLFDASGVHARLGLSFSF